MSHFTQRRTSGFTLVEMLVVLAIIGILTAILVPTIGIAVRTVRQGAIRTEMKQMETAIENYKTKYHGYPLGFNATAEILTNPGRTLFLEAHVKQISRRAMPDSGFGYWTWVVSPLPNPHYDGSIHPNSYQFRTPATMMPHEAMVFFLSELSTNAEFPLGYRPDPSGGYALVDYQYDNTNDRWVLTGNKQEFFDFNDGRLMDKDQDGWLEYYPSGGLDAPYAYFDARIYNNTTNVLDVTYDFETGGAGINQTGVVGAGYASPYVQSTGGMPVNADTYQLICSGMDNSFGTTFGILKGFPRGENWLNEDRDNLANFVQLRLDENLVE